jgi:endo-1,4-beta-D-glucanase Y
MAAVFHDACNTSANFNLAGSNTTFGGNNGMFGVLGASGSMHINFSGGNFVFEGAKKNLGSTCTIFSWYYRPDAAATIGNGNSIFTVCTDGTYATSSSPARIDVTKIDATHIKFSLVDPSNSFTSTAGTTSIVLGTAVRLTLYQTSAGWYLYLNNGTTPEITYTHTQATVGMQYVCWGTLFENATGSYTGIADLDDIYCGNQAAAPSTTAAKVADIYQGYLQNHLSAEGMPYRGPADGNNLSSVSTIDTTSETAAYVLLYAVQNNDQPNFILCDNWILANLIRSVSTVGNTQNNAAPVTALNLMATHYNSANTDGKGIGTIYDANFATDAENERAQALLWAHARWGSSSLTVGSGGELTTPNYKQRALNVIADLKAYAFSNSTGTGYNYEWNDALQNNTTIQSGGDYYAPAGFRLFGSYDPTNVSYWSNAAAGSYDALTKAANVIMSGETPAQVSTSHLNPDWFTLTVATAVVSTTPSTYGDSDYGYNAFRIYQRLYEAYVFYNDASALSALQLPKSFFAAEWLANSMIRATFKHDGTNTGAYENNMFTFAAYWTQYANDNTNTTAAAMISNKLTTRYSQQPYGSIYNESPSSGATVSYGYFGQSWLLRAYMMQNGLWINYGQNVGQFFAFF